MVSNIPQRTYPYGMSVEIIGRKAMEYAYSKMNDDLYKEHVTKYLYDHKEVFKIHVMTSGQTHFSGVQLAVDTQEDLDQFKWIVSQLKYNLEDIDVDTLVNLSKKFFIFNNSHQDQIK
jgi:spore coat polysaccharide biosynthesis protein SpsF